jgi:hypothetical protein
MHPGDRPHLAAPTSLGDRPLSPNTNTFGRSPPNTSLNLKLLTQTYHCSTLASYPKAVGSVRLDRVLEELSLCNWGANRPLTRKLS